MPTYEYRCEKCGTSVEVVQRFSDDPLTECETCGGRLRKVYAPVGIVFKGSGFYKTDSRGTSKRSTVPDAKPASADAGTSDPAPATTSPSEAKPAAAASADNKAPTGSAATT